jgi:TolB-like protein
MALEPKVPLRVGIHLGDIITTKEEIIGDAVNLASRIESLGIPGSVLISSQVQLQIRNHGIHSKSLGQVSLKNVSQPIEVFAISEEGLTVPAQIRIKGNRIPRRSSRSLTFRQWKIYTGATIGLLVLVYLFVITPLTINKTKRTGNTKDTPVMIENDEIDKSIAVLPFLNLTNDPEQEYFSDGMMDEILNHLYKIGGLRIPSRTSSMRYKGVTDKTIGEMGQELGVAHALEGSVRKYGDTVRIIASLVNVATDDQIWSLSFKEEYRDIFAIQSTIAQKIAEELKAHISVEVKQRIEAIPTENTEAYNLYLQARYYLTETMELEKAKVLLDEAIHLDDKFAEAHALLGYYWLFRGSWLGDLQPEQLIHEALPLLNKARELNEDYPITYAFLSQVHLWYRWDFEDAGKAWDMFFQLSPSKQAMNSSYCDFLNASGRSEEAAAIVDKAVSSDPSYSSWGSGLSYYFNNQPYRAIQHYETARKLFPSNDGLRNGLGRV